MTFFYNLNDKLNAIREKPETTHKQLNERDMGKHNNKTTGFDALAKKAGKEYGSKAAGERVAGAQFQKMKKAGQLEEAGNDLKSYSTSALKAASSKDANADKKSGVSAQHSTQQIKDELKRRNKEVDEDMSRAAKGYEKYGKQGMQALAKAGREGKALDPVRNKYDKYDEGMDEAIRIMAKPEGSKVTRGTAAYVPKNSIAGKTPQGQAHRDATAAMAKSARAAGGKLAMNKTTDATGKRVPGGYDAMAKGVTPYRSSTEEGMGDVVKKVGSAVKKVGGAVLNKLGHGSDEDMRKDLQRKMGMPQTGKKPQELDELSPATLTSYAGKRAGQGTWAGGVAKGLAGRPAERDGYADSHWTDPKVNYGSEGEKYAKFNQKALGNIKKAHAKGATPNNQSYDWGKEGGYGDASNPVTRKKGMAEEGGAPMTAKQKSFAKLAPPADKITFADKIAGAKKEVDEMLGDVAAEAIKGALSPKQKKIDMNKNGRLDANDFAMLRKGGKKQVADEGWDEMEKDVKSRMGARKVGDVTHGDKHDTQEIPGGRRVTRRVDPNTGYSVGADSDAPADGEKRGRGRPKKSDAPRQERVTAKSRKTDRTAWSKKKTNEDDFDITDRGEYDQEGEMAKDDIKTIVRHAQALQKVLGDNDNLPEWVQAKLAKIEGMMTAVDDYMQNQQDDEQSLDEKEITDEHWGMHAQLLHNKKKEQEKVVKPKEPEKKKPDGKEKEITDEHWGMHAHWLRGDHKRKDDNRAEKAGKKVTKDIEYDEKKKDDIHGKRRGSEDDKAERAGKKVTKDIEYDEKKKKVKEQGGADTPTASSGFSFGQGIYDSMNHELETMIRESMNISMNMNTDATGGPSKSVTVTATDDDAMKLGELLKNAGLGGHDYPHVEGGADLDHPGAIEVNGTMDAEGAEQLAQQIRQAMGDHDHAEGEVCDACGQEDCGCEEVDEAYGDDVVSQNEPDFPTNTETAQDSFEYSGGLNGPKSTGQTTIPVIAGQEERMGADDLHRLREMAGIREAAKPDFPDVDNDGNKKETIEKAVDDKKAAGDKKVAESLMAELQRFMKA